MTGLLLEILGNTKPFKVKVNVDQVTKIIINQYLNFLINKDLEGVVTKKSKDKLKEALSNYFKKNIDINISISNKNLSTIYKKNEKDYNDKITSANKKIDDDDFIKTIKEKFNAKSIESSVQIDD